MALDNPIPLVTVETFSQGAFADLARAYDPNALDRIAAQATRGCESEAGRRLAPFTITETHRAAGVDPDEYTDSASLPMDLVGTVGRSYAAALGATTLVRHLWLREYAPIFSELWTYKDVRIEVVRSYGGSEIVGTGQFVGAEPDSGHIWFQLGKFIPIGSLFRVTYSGGYTTVPADLERAATFMMASIIARELDPLGQSYGHHPDGLEGLAVAWLNPYGRAK